MSWKNILKNWESKFDWTTQPRGNRGRKTLRGNGPDCAEAGREYMIHEVLEQLWNDPSQRIRKQFYEGMPAAAFMDMMEAMVQNPDRVAYNFEIFTRGLLEQEIQGARKVVQDFDICWNANKSIYPPVVTEGNAMASSMEFTPEQAERILSAKEKNPDKSILDLSNDGSLADTHRTMGEMPPTSKKKKGWKKRRGKR
tara:strand:+ start:11894 stop:12484 length:591 start_codon:yes stop_codon:yes gene_type:complete